MKNDEIKSLIDGLYNIVLCQRNLHYVFELPKPKDIILIPDTYQCNIRLNEMPSDRDDAVVLFVDELLKYSNELSDIEISVKGEQEKLLFDLIVANMSRLLEHYKGLISGENC